MPTQLSSLVSVSDADNDTITKYQLWDGSRDPNSGHWVVNGVAQAAGTVTLPSRQIDGLVAERGLRGPFFLKFDTHGAELAILAGARKTLGETGLIMMEVYNFKLNFTGGKNLTFDEMCIHLRTLGFRMVDLCLPLHRPGDGVFWQAHFFFVQASHPVFKSNSYKAPSI